MITEEMRQVWYGSDLSFDVDEADKKIQRIIELHEQSKPKPEPVGYTLDVLKEYFYAGFMSSGEGFNGEWGGMKSCDTAWEEYSAMQNKLQEANKPKPEPYGYVRSMLSDDLWLPQDFIDGEENRDLWIPLYTTPPTREPLSEDEKSNLVMEYLGVKSLLGKDMSVLEAFELGISAAEQAHVIGVK